MIPDLGPDRTRIAGLLLSSFSSAFNTVIYKLPKLRVLALSFGKSQVEKTGGSSK
jgi:hypothetical protein